MSAKTKSKQVRVALQSSVFAALGAALLASPGCLEPNPNITVGKTWLLTGGGDVFLQNNVKLTLGGPHQTYKIAAKRCLCGADQEAMLAGSDGTANAVQAARFEEITAQMRLEAIAKCEVQAHAVAGIDYVFDTCQERSEDVNAWDTPWADCIISAPSCPTPSPGNGSVGTEGDGGTDDATDSETASGEESGSAEAGSREPPFSGPALYGVLDWDDVIDCKTAAPDCNIDEDFVKALLFSPLVVTHDDVVVAPAQTRERVDGYRLVSFAGDSLLGALNFRERDVIVRVNDVPVTGDPIRLLKSIAEKPSTSVELFDARGKRRTRSFHKVELRH